MHDHRAVPLLLLAASLVGCSAADRPSISPSGVAAASARPTGEPAGSTPAIAPSQTPALGPSLRLTLDRSGPMVASDAGPSGHHWVLPAAGARDRDGGFVLFIVWFGDEAGDQVVTVARSDDGRAWRIGTDPILSDLGMDLVNPGAIPAAALQLADGTWQLFGWAAHAADRYRFTSWRASAPTPEGPWSLDDAAVLAVGPAGAWDSEVASVGAARLDDDGYRLWYEGQGPGNGVRGDIGLASSANGRSWQKWDDPATAGTAFADSDPVLRRGMCGTGTALALYQPQVETWSGGLAALVGAFGLSGNEMDVFGLTSVDGRTWACGSLEPVLRARDIPGSQGIHTIATLPLDGDRFELVIESLADERSELWSAIVDVGG